MSHDERRENTQSVSLITGCGWCPLCAHSARRFQFICFTNAAGRLLFTFFWIFLNYNSERVKSAKTNLAYDTTCFFFHEPSARWSECDTEVQNKQRTSTTLQTHQVFILTARCVSENSKTTKTKMKNNHGKNTFTTFLWHRRHANECWTIFGQLEDRWLRVRWSLADQTRWRFRNYLELDGRDRGDQRARPHFTRGT